MVGRGRAKIAGAISLSLRRAVSQAVSLPGVNLSLSLVMGVGVGGVGGRVAGAVLGGTRPKWAGGEFTAAQGRR